MSDADEKSTTLRLRAIDKKDGEIVKIESDLVALPDNEAYNDERFKGVMDAIVAFYAANPTLNRLEVEIIEEEDA